MVCHYTPSSFKMSLCYCTYYLLCWFLKGSDQKLQRPPRDEEILQQQKIKGTSTACVVCDFMLGTQVCTQVLKVEKKKRQIKQRVCARVSLQFHFPSHLPLRISCCRMFLMKWIFLKLFGRGEPDRVRHLKWKKRKKTKNKSNLQCFWQNVA